MMITDKINFKQPKYVLPAILYPLLLISGYLIFDIFDTEPARNGECPANDGVPESGTSASTCG